jgi:hypothetical protein
VEVPVPDGFVLKKLKIFKTAYESDVVISVPTMKTHILTGVTLGLKNMKGTLPDKMKKLMHRIGVTFKTSLSISESERTVFLFFLPFLVMDSSPGIFSMGLSVVRKLHVALEQHLLHPFSGESYMDFRPGGQKSRGKKS